MQKQRVFVSYTPISYENNENIQACVKFKGSDHSNDKKYSFSPLVVSSHMDSLSDTCLDFKIFVSKATSRTADHSVLSKQQLKN